MNISDGVRKIRDIAALDRISAVKSDDGLVHIFGKFFNCHRQFSCEHSNIFDICNSMMAQSPVSTHRVYTNEESDILNDLEAAFNDQVSLMLCSMCLAIFLL